MKKSITIQLEHLSVLSELTDEQAGQLFKAIRAHHNGEEIECSHLIKGLLLPFKARSIEKKQPTESLEVRQEKFANLVHGYVDRYGKDMCLDFFRYWTEPNPSKTKMRFEMEKTYDIERRIITWAKNQKTFNNAGNRTDNRNQLEQLLGQSLDILQQP